MKYKILFFLISLSFFFNACASQPYLKENSAFIVFKTTTQKYADMGFIYKNNSEVKLEVYSSGQALVTLKVTDNLVCMSTLACVSKENFNKDVLATTYPKDILDNIFRGKPIFAGTNMKKVFNGFTQKVVKHNIYNINYSVLNGNTIFVDNINNIVIKVKNNI